MGLGKEEDRVIVVKLPLLKGKTVRICLQACFHIYLKKVTYYKYRNSIHVKSHVALETIFSMGMMEHIFCFGGGGGGHITLSASESR